MALTRAHVETILVKRAAKLLTFLDMAVTIIGSNADLNDPIGVAIRACSGTTVSPVLITDADVATVAVKDYDMLFDIAEYRLVMTMIGNFDKYGLKVGPRSGYQSQVRDGMQTMLGKMYDNIVNNYGFNAASPEIGVLSLDFAEHNEDAPTS